MSGSLKNTTTPESIANEIILERKSPAWNNKILILVEGKDDRIFYYKFFDNNFSEIKDCKGCKKVIDVYNLLNKKIYSDFITIKDSDFDRINGKNKLGDNFFYSDCHDYEMMCLKNKNTINKLFAHLAMKYDDEIINNVFEDLRYISFFKWYNYTSHCNYNFRVLTIRNLPKNLLHDFGYIHNILLKASKNCVSINEQILEQFIDKNIHPDLYEITNGHDFISRLTLYLEKNNCSINNMNEDKLKLILHPCFDTNDFQQTELYRDIKMWQDMRGKTILCV